MISDNFYVPFPEWFLFLYFKYWYFRSLKRFWDCDIFGNVVELHQSMEEWYPYNERVLIWRFTLVLIKIKYGQIGDQTGLFYTTNPLFYTSGNRIVRRTGTIGNLWFVHLSRRTTVIQDLLVRRQFSLVPDNRTNVNVEVWPDFIKSLYASIPRRVRQVLRANGCITKYWRNGASTCTFSIKNEIWVWSL